MLSPPADSVELVVRNPDDEVVRRLDGPTASGTIHRVQWDLTHPPPLTEDEDEEDEESGVVEPDTILPELEYPLDPKGSFMRPGTYTVTLYAGETEATKPVEVRGASEMDLTAKAWRERESFLLDVLDAQRTAFHAAQRADSLHARLQTLAEDRDASDELSALVDTAEIRADELGDLRGEIYGLGWRLQLERRHAAVAAAAHDDASTALRAAPRSASGRNSRPEGTRRRRAVGPRLIGCMWKSNVPSSRNNSPGLSIRNRAVAHSDCTTSRRFSHNDSTNAK